MKRLYLTAYRYHDLDEEATRALTKKFTELGGRPGLVAHYERLDGRGGFIVQEVADDPEKDFERNIQLSQWMDIEVIPVSTMEDAFPVIVRVYG